MKNSFSTDRKKNNGSALIVVLCVLALLMALSAALLVSTHSVVNSNAQYTDNIQCKLLNQSFGNSLISTIVNDDADSFGGKLVALAKSGTDSKSFSVSDNATNAIHDISIKIYKRSETDMKYEMFVTVDTNYKDMRYSQTIRFTSSKSGDAFYWTLANTDKNETGVNPS